MKRIAFLAALLVLTPANAQITRIPVMVDGSGTVATGGTSQQVFAADQYRNYLMCMNPSSATEKLYIEYGAAASTTNGKSIPLDPGGVAASAAQAKADAAATPTSVTSAVSAATSGLATSSALTSLAATVPVACTTTPMPDTLVGSVGTATPCSPRPDNTRPTVIQAKNTTTASDATWSVTFDTAFASTPIYADARVYGSTTPYICTVSSLSATAASGKCFQLVTTTLPTLATSLLGLVVSPFVTAGSGLSVRVVARQ